MYLSRLTLDTRRRDTRVWLADCHALHRLLMSGFPDVETDQARAELGVLFRVDAMATPPAIPVLVQSRALPRWVIESDAVLSIDPPRSMGALLDVIQDDRFYRFRLRANPTRRVHQRATLGGDEAAGRARAERQESVGKRVEVRGEEDRLQWLVRQGERAGFSLRSARLEPSGVDFFAARANPGGTLGGRSGHDRRLTFGTALFEGVLQVRNADVFRSAVAQGIGPGKAFGCGLLSIAPVDPS